MGNLKILTAVGLLAAAGAAHAGVSSTVTAASDYDFRGITQTANDPALQASLDYAHDSGWYIGAWASNLDWGPADVDVEVDVYTGFSGTTEGGLGWDAGIIYYAYPDESDFDMIEIYGSISKDWFKGKLWYSNDFGGDSNAGNNPAFYVEGNGTFPLPANFSILAHVGYSFGDYWSDADIEYFDYSIGVGLAVGNFNFAVKYVDGSDLPFSPLPSPDQDVFSTDDRIILTVATTFPWK